MAGAPIYIIINDGEEVQTTNLDHNGRLHYFYYPGDRRGTTKITVRYLGDAWSEPREKSCTLNIVDQLKVWLDQISNLS